MRDLARLGEAKKLRLNVVFDGAPDPQFPDGSSYRGVRIFYSRYGSDADARIIEMVEAERNKKSLVVVTSDGKLISRVRACGARVMRSGAFRHMLDQIPDKMPDRVLDRTQGKPVKPIEKAPDQGPDTLNIEPNDKDDEIKEWLRYFGVEESDNS
jgi:predicted RNA-binding protein with PIN domain